MEKNQLLTISAVLCKFFCFLAILFFLILTVSLIHWHISPDFYVSRNALLELSAFDSFFKITYNEISENSKSIKEAAFFLSEVKPVSLYLLYIQLSFIALFVFLIFKEFLKIINSVKLVQTFRTGNIKSFRKIGKFLFVIFLLSSFNMVQLQEGAFYGFFIHLTPLVLMLLAFILAEVFKEGNNLSEESELTI